MLGVIGLQEAVIHHQPKRKNMVQMKSGGNRNKQMLIGTYSEVTRWFQEFTMYLLLVCFLMSSICTDEGARVTVSL